MRWNVEHLPDGRVIATDTNGDIRATVEQGDVRICWQEDGKEVDWTDAPTIPVDVLRTLLEAK